MDRQRFRVNSVWHSAVFIRRNGGFYRRQETVSGRNAKFADMNMKIRILAAIALLALTAGAAWQADAQSWRQDSRTRKSLPESGMQQEVKRTAHPVTPGSKKIK